MANLQLTWDSSAMASATDIDSLHVITIDNDVTASFPQTNNQITAAAAETFAATAGATVITQSLTKTGGAWPTSYTHQNVTNPGNGKTWGVFSYNTAGYGPGTVFYFNNFT